MGTPGYYAMGPGMRQNFGLMYDNIGQMHQMMGQGYMSPYNYNQMMGMTGQMGGMMGQMSRPYYGPETAQQQRQELEQMHQRLSAMQRQGVVPRKESNLGARLFEANCASCHPNGGNIITPNLPLRGSAQLADFTRFLEFVRHPHMPNGARGAMPALSPAQLSDTQVREIYQYVITW